MDEAWLLGMKAKIDGIITEVQGMVAENQHRMICGDQVAYVEENFFDKAEELHAIADTIFKSR